MSQRCDACAAWLIFSKARLHFSTKLSESVLAGAPAQESLFIAVHLQINQGWWFHMFPTFPCHVLFFLNFHPWYGGWSSTAEIVEFWVPTTSWCPSAFSGVRWFNSKNEHHELCRLIATPFISIYVKFQHVGFHGQPTCFPAKLRRGHGLARQQLGWLEAALKILELRRTYRWCDGPTQWAKTWDAKLLSCGDTGYVVGSCQDFMAEEQLSTRFWWTWICLSKVLSNNINACNRAILEQHKFDFGSCSLRFVRITYVANSSFYSLQEHATA